MPADLITASPGVIVALIGLSLLGLVVLALTDRA